jgi:hypothetical protein
MLRRLRYSSLVGKSLRFDVRAVGPPKRVKRIKQAVLAGLGVTKEVHGGIASVTPGVEVPAKLQRERPTRWTTLDTRRSGR